MIKEIEQSQLIDLQKIAKERTVKTQTIEYDLQTLIKKIKNKVIKLDPEYQRKHRWSDDISSRLIESLILNIPIPIIYISQDVDVDEETEESRYSVIDGQQRLTAIYDFMNNQYALEGMPILKPLNGYKYESLPPFLIRRLEERTIKCLRIDSTVDPQVKYDIFERLNSGSIELTNQELRNAVYRGSFNELIKELAQIDEFRKLINIKVTQAEQNPKVKKMEDVELVLRFLALDNDNYKNYTPLMKDFLNDFMDRNRDLPQEDLVTIKKRFERVIKYILFELGEKAFAKYSEEGVLKSSFNTAVYDAIIIGISSSSVFEKQLKITTQQKQNLRSLFGNESFIYTITGSTNDKEKLLRRISLVRGAIGE